MISVAVLDAPTDDAMTARILDGAFDQLVEHGVRYFSVEDVARRVGINRITIYRRFAGKDDVLQAVIFREARRLFARVDEAVASIRSPEHQLVEGFTASVLGVRDHPIVQRVLATEPDMLASLIISYGAATIALGRSYLTGYLANAEVFAELAVRVGLSFILIPESCIPLAGEDDLRAFARSYLVPALKEVRRRR